MLTKTISVSSEAKEHDRGFHAAFLAVKQARNQHVEVRPHRAITPLKVTPYLLAQALILPIVLCAALLWGKPLILDFWRDCIVFWSGGLSLPFARATQLTETGQYASRLSNAGVETQLGTSAELVRLIRSDKIRFEQLAKSANIKAE